MKKITHSLIAMISISSFGIAGANFAMVPAPVLPVPQVAEEDNSGFYLGLGLNYNRNYSTKSAWFDVIDSQDETGGLTGIIGYTFNPYISIEARIAKSLYEEDYADILSYSFFLKPQYPVTEDFSIYALLGYGNVTVDATDAGGLEYGFDPSRIGETIMDESGFQWGLGIGYVINEDFSLFVDYVSFVKDADITPTSLYWYSGAVAGTAAYDIMSNDALTLGVTYKF